MDNILIIPGGLQIGGAEKVAANISKYAPKGEFCFHYIVFEGNENVYGPEIEADGGKVFTIPSPSAGYKQYVKTLGELIDKYKYKAVHSHTMFNSGINLAVAKKHGVPIRISHSHTTKTETKVSLKQKMYEKLMRKIILRNATDLFSCGVEAGYWLYGEKAFKKRGKVLLNGIDVKMNAYNEAYRNEIREKLGMADKFIIGHCGHLVSVKNQKYLINIMSDILKINQNAVLLLLGEGNDKVFLEELIKSKGLEDKIILYGSTLEVYKFLNAFDVFAFPSLREGTPLALLEAQANGLPCVISENIPQDAFLTDLIQVISLEDKEKWVSEICQSNRKFSEKYSDSVSNTGYSANNAYMPIYEAYRR